MSKIEALIENLLNEKGVNDQNFMRIFKLAFIAFILSIY